jgi:hypothetical protein
LSKSKELKRKCPASFSRTLSEYFHFRENHQILSDLAKILAKRKEFNFSNCLTHLFLSYTYLYFRKNYRKKLKVSRESTKISCHLNIFITMVTLFYPHVAVNFCLFSKKFKENQHLLIFVISVYFRKQTFSKVRKLVSRIFGRKYENENFRFNPTRRHRRAGTGWQKGVRGDGGRGNERCMVKVGF